MKKLGVEGICINIAQAMDGKFIANIIVNVERHKAFPLK